MTFLLFFTLVFLAGWYFGAKDKSKTNESSLEQRNLEWAQFIASYKKQSKTKQEKELVIKMLSDISSSGLPIDDKDIVDITVNEVEPVAPLRSTAATLVGGIENNLQAIETNYTENVTMVDEAEESDIIQLQDDSQPTDIDGPSLLLYFGAFLFIASAGLFVAFGQISGFIKTIIVLVIVAVLYALGLWLYKNQPKFNQVGIAFAGISLAVAPLVGLTAYSYIFNESSGDLVWFLTSLFCLAFYLHALVVLKKPLINYIFIFTFLSLFESGVSIIEAPIYYFGWGLALVGIITMLAAKLNFLDESFKEASSNTSVFFIPLSVIVSLAMIPSEGFIQLSISLLLASIYYLLQFFIDTDDSNRFNYLAVSHVSAIASTGAMAYSINSSLKDVAIVLLVLNITQFLLAQFYKIPDAYKNNFLSILIISSLLAMLFSWQSPEILLLNLVALVIICLSLWFRYKDDSLYGLGLISIPAIPLYYSYFVVDQSLSYTQVALYLFIAMLAMQMFYFYTQKIISIELEGVAKYSIWAVGLALMLLAFAGNNTLATLALIYATVLINISFGLYLKSKDFSIAASALLLLVSIFALALNTATPSIITVNIVAFILVNLFIWIKYSEPNAFNLAFITIPILPLYVSFFLVQPQLTIPQVAFNLVLALIMLYIVYYFANKRLSEQNLFLAKAIILIVSFISILISFGGDSPVDIVLISYLVLLLSAVFGILYKERDFMLAGGIIAALPILRFVAGGQALFYTALIALIYNIYSALKYREELFRWLGSLIWFSFPAVLSAGFSLSWGVNEFCVAYMVVSVGFMLARSIARGAVFASSKIPLVSYDRNKSLSYVFGNIVALFLVAVLSLVSQDAQLLSSITFSYITIAIILSAKFIEKNQYLYALVPISLQALILTSIRPDKTNGLLDFYAFASITAAVATYYIAIKANIKADAKNWLVNTSLLSAYTVSFLSLGSEYSWMAPFTLLVAGSLTVYHFWKDGQQARELSGAIVGVSIMWVLYYFGIREAQAYTHVVAAQLALYAYFRFKLGQQDNSDKYIVAALATATVPLIIQAISSESGGLYGWWLLLEQIGFMLIGLSIKNKLMTLWGLYVAIGAVLYQLRSLGWAALTLLAVVIIGIAIYKISKNNDSK